MKNSIAVIDCSTGILHILTNVPTKAIKDSEKMEEWLTTKNDFNLGEISWGIVDSVELNYEPFVAEDDEI